jgi:hypothetical protein
MQDLGMKNNAQAQQQFAEMRQFTADAVEQGQLMGEFDLESSYAQNKQSYDQFFAALKDGVPNGQGGKRPLTKEEKILILKNMGK